MQIAASVLLVLVGIHLARVAAPLAALESLGRPLWRRIQPVAAKLMPFDTPGRAFAAGLAWGWLPCGLVYAALAGGAWAGWGGRSEFRGTHRQTSTGMLEWVSSLLVSLPNTIADRPRRPWDAITIRSHFFDFAARRIPR